MVSKIGPNKKRAIKVFSVYIAGLVFYALTTLTPFSIPCLIRTVSGIPCPGCGLTRAFIMAGQMDIFGAITMNILFLPLVILGAAYFICACMDFFGKNPNSSAISRLNIRLNSKWFLIPIIPLVVASWAYNIIRGI